MTPMTTIKMLPINIGSKVLTEGSSGFRPTRWRPRRRLSTISRSFPFTRLQIIGIRGNPFPVGCLVVEPVPGQSIPDGVKYVL